MLNTNNAPAPQAVYLMTADQVAELAASIAAIVADSMTGHRQKDEAPGEPAEEIVWISRQQAADILAVSIPTIHDLMNSGALVFQKVGRRTLINKPILIERMNAGKLAKYERRKRKPGAAQGNGNPSTHAEE